MIDGILPAAGLATRMRGLPKFLLPGGGVDSPTLIERHISGMLEFCSTVWIPTRPEQIMLLDSLRIPSERVVLLPMSTVSMTETVMRVSNISGSSRFMMIMPDTFFAGETPYEFLASGNGPMTLACWNIRDEQKGKLGQVLLSNEPEGTVLSHKDKDPDCDFSISWGAMSLSKDILDYAKSEMPHTGYLIPKLLEKNLEIKARVIQGTYYDCGTPSEYISMLTKNLESN